MAILAEQIVRSLKFFSTSDKNHHKKNPKPLDDFLLKISNVLNEPFFKPRILGSKHLSLEWFQNCFDLIMLADGAFAKLLIEIEYPMSQWGGKATHEYLNYSLGLLEKLNTISSSLSHVRQAKVSFSHALEKNSPAKCVRKINPAKVLKDVDGSSSAGIGKRPGSDKKEDTILEAVTVLKKIGCLALELVLSGFDETVEEVNRDVQRLLEGKCDVGELKGRLVVLENCVQGVEKRVNDMFSHVFSERSKLMDNIR